MRERLTGMIKIGCLALGVLVAYQVYGLVMEEDPFADMSVAGGRLATGDWRPETGTVTATAVGTATATATATAAGTATATASANPPAAGRQPPASPETLPLPDRYQPISSSGLLGALPQPPPPPALLGLAGKYAIIRAPSGQVDLVPEGGELGGVKVLRIAMNRVLIHHEGKEQELSIFSGLGSPPLVPQGKDAKPR